MDKEPTIPSRRRSPLLLWSFLAVIGLAVAGMLLPVGSRPIIDRARLIDVETSQIHTALLDYEAAFGAFPTGDSSAIFRALRGENLRKLLFLQCPSDRVSAEGSMLDPWGTPYKIYFSGKEPLIRSAGPNKQFDDSGRKQFDDYIR